MPALHALYSASGRTAVVRKNAEEACGRIDHRAELVRGLPVRGTTGVVHLGPFSFVFPNTTNHEA